MNRSLRSSFAVAVFVVCGCGKKTESPASVAPPPSPSPVSTPAKTSPTTATAIAQEPARSAAAPVTPVPGELPIIAKARAFLGTESALNAITSIHYFGTLTTTDPTDAKKQTRASIEIVLQKPDRQRVTITSDKTIESTALNGYEAWTRITAAQDPTKWQQTLLGVDGVKRLRANTWENLAFFRGIGEEGGTVEDKGPATVDGIECEKVAFVHAPNIIFNRYFDPNTGRVVFSETESGGTIREQGEVIVNGVRFPKSIVTVSKNQAGQQQTVSITFDKILVNENLPPDFFSVPALKNR